MAAICHSQVTWRGETVDEESLASTAQGDSPLARMVRNLGHRWRLQNMDLLQSEDYMMEDAYDSARVRAQRGDCLVEDDTEKEESATAH